MTMPTLEETIAEFCIYVRDICSQSPEEQGNRLETVMARFADTSVRIASSKLVPTDVVIAAWTNEELAEQMQRHVAFRSSGGRLTNSAWDMMLEAAKRLNMSALTRQKNKPPSGKVIYRNSSIRH